MMDIAAIEAASREAAVSAAAKKKLPYVPFDEKEIQSETVLKHIPYIGDYRPEGWQLIDKWFCDHSGMGAEDEPALTIGQLKAKMLDKYNTDCTCGYGIIEIGPFQLFLGVFTKIERRKSKHGQKRSTKTTKKRVG